MLFVLSGLLSCYVIVNLLSHISNQGAKEKAFACKCIVRCERLLCPMAAVGVLMDASAVKLGCLATGFEEGCTP
jgi:hypothetical protein